MAPDPIMTLCTYPLPYLDACPLPSEAGISFGKSLKPRIDNPEQDRGFVNEGQTPALSVCKFSVFTTCHANITRGVLNNDRLGGQYKVSCTIT